MIPCPDVAELERLLDESLPADRLDEIVKHLHECTACEASLDRLTSLSADSRLMQLAEPHRTPSFHPMPSTVGGGGTSAPASLPPSPPGYVIVREIGRGGMGVVYLARQRGLNRTVALKMVLAGGYASPEQAARFQSEAEITARFRHPNIVQVHEVGTHDGRPFLAMEYVEGGTLAADLGKEPRPPREAAALIECLARAAHYAHTHGIVHRDLKPGNVLGSAAGVVKIADFGLAKSVEGGGDVTASGAVVGTPNYMAPEQALGARAVGPACDIYALGSILYECLTGRPPFLGTTPVETAMRVINDEPVPVKSIQPRTPADLSTVCMKCLEKSPARRYATAKDFADDLRRFLDGRPVAARPLRLPGRVLKWARRSPAVAGLWAAVALSVLVGAGLVVWQWGREKSTRLEMERLSAGLLIDQGVALCDQGDVGPGLLTFADGLALAVQAGDAPRERLARLQLAAWQREYIRPVARLKHGRNVVAVAFSADGKFAATAGREGTARIWDAETGAAVGPPLQHAQSVASVSFSPDGTKLLTSTIHPKGAGPGEVRLWDVATRESVAFPQEVSVGVTRFAPDGKRFLAIVGNQLHVWAMNDLHAGRHPTPQWDLWCATFSPDSKTVLIGGSNTARLVDAATGEVLKNYPHPKTTVLCVAFRGDGKRFVAGASDGYARIWDAEAAETVGQSMRHKGPVKSVRFEGDVIATGCDCIDIDPASGQLRPVSGEARVWDGTGRAATRPLPHPDPVWSVDLARGGSLLATGCQDGFTRVFHAGSGALVGRPLPNTGTVREVVFSPDGRGLLSAGDGGDEINGASAGLWHFQPEVGRLQPAAVWPGSQSCHFLTYAPDGASLFVGYYKKPGSRGVLFDVATGRPPVGPWEHPDEIDDGVVSPDGRTLVTASVDKVLRVWDRDTGKLLRSLSEGNPRSPVAFSPDGRLIAASCDGPSVRTWRVSDGAAEGDPLPQPSRPWRLRFSADGRRLWTVSDDHTVREWDIAGGATLRSWSQPGELGAPAFSPDGTALIAAAAAGRVVQIRDLATGDPLGEPLLHPTPVIDSVAMSTDNRMAITGGGRDARLWDTATSRRVGPPIATQDYVLRVAFDPHGKTFAVVGNSPLLICDVPVPMSGSPGELRLWAESLTGQYRTRSGVVRDSGAAP